MYRKTVGNEFVPTGSGRYGRDFQFVGTEDRAVVLKYSFKIKAAGSVLVSRERLDMLVQSTRTMVVTVGERVGFTIFTMVSLVSMSGTGAESPLISCRLTIL